MTLSGPLGIIEEGETFGLTQGDTYDSIKKFTGKGKWYFEATHYESPTQYHLFGFAAPNGRGLFFYYFPNKPVIYDQYRLSNGSWVAISPSLPFSIENEHTIGIGIDTFVGQFYVFYDKYYSTYSFNPNDFRQNLRVRIWGAWDSKVNTKVSVNFGSYSHFKYNISTFIPWSKNPHYLSCHSIHFSFKAIIVSIFMFVNKL